MTIQQSTYAAPRADLGEAFMEYSLNDTRFAASLILPVMPVMKKEATLSVITRESMLKRADAKRASGSAFNRVNLYAEDLSYACQEYGLEGPLPDDVRENYATDFDAEEATVRQVWHKLMNEREIRTASEIFDATTNWPSGTSALYTDVSSAPWDAAGSDVIGHVIDAKEQVRKNCGLNPNALIIGAATLSNLLQNTGIKNRFPGVDLLTESMLRGAMPSIFGIDRVIVGQSVYDSKPEGTAFSGSDVWSDDYALVAVVADPGAPLATPCIGRTVLWTGQSPEEWIVEQYREEQTTSEIYRCRHYLEEKVFDPYFGHLLKVDA